MPKVSVIMPVYNGEKFVAQAVESVLSQSFIDFEFIIIDDASTDNTSQVLRQFDDPRIKLVTNSENIGIARSRNKGLKISHGEYIAVQDADDISHPDRFALQAKFLDEHPDMAAVGSWYVVIDEEGEELGRVKLWTRNDDIRAVLLKKNQFAHGSAMIRRECLEAIGGYRHIEYCTDYDLFLRLAERYKLANLPRYLYKWRKHADQKATNSELSRFYAQMVREAARERGKLPEEHDGKKIKLAVCCGHLSTGGMPRYVLNHLKHLVSRRYDVWVFEGSYAGIDEIRDQIRALPHIKFHSINPADFPEFARMERFDVVHYHDWPHEHRSREIPSVETVHSPFSTPGPADHYVVVDPALTDKLSVPSDSITYVPSPVDEDVFDLNSFREINRQKLMEELELPADKRVVVYTAVVAPHKGHEELLKHWKLDEAVLVFVGPLADNFKDYWQPLVDRYAGETIRFVGATRDVDKYLAVADVYVSPSKAEGCPIAVLEAAAMKVPLVLSDIPGHRSLFEEHEAIFARTPSELVDAVKVILKDNELAESMSKAAREKVLNKHSAFAHALQMDEIYEKLVARKPVRGMEFIEGIYGDRFFVMFNVYPTFYIPRPVVGDFRVRILDDDGNSIYETEINKHFLSSHCWAQAFRRDWGRYKFEVYERDEKVWEKELELEGQRVKIINQSPALGDMLAWVPYVFEFADKYKLERVNVVSPNLSNDRVEVLKMLETDRVKFEDTRIFDHVITLGAYKANEVKRDYRVLKLQEMATDILGLPFEERRLDLSGLAGSPIISGDYVCIAPKASVRPKEWNCPGGWQRLVNWLRSQGFKVVWISKEPCELEGVKDRSGDKALIERITELKHAKFFIGVSSGLSWLAWSVGTHVFMINGPTYDWHEFENNVDHISRLDVCRGCWNDLNFQKPGHCPRDRYYECTRFIYPEMVARRIEEWLGRSSKS